MGDKMIEIEKLTKIGRGMTAEIYALDSEKVLKVFFEPFCGGYALNEWESAKAAYANGIPTPKVYEMTNVSFRDAIVFQRLTNFNVENMLVEKPYKVKSYARAMAEIQLKIHSTIPKGKIAKLQDVYPKAVLAKKGLTGAEKTFIVDLIRKLPTDNKLCHGDFHPQNILLDHGMPYVIDWTAGVIGNPMADICATYLIMKTASTHKKVSKPVKIIKDMVLRSFLKEYLRTYFAGSSYTLTDMNMWLPVRAAIYLDVGLPPDCEINFKNIIRKSMKDKI